MKETLEIKTDKETEAIYMQKTELKTNLPEKKFRAGAISATVWKNHTERDGKVVEYDYPRIPIRIARKNKIRFYGRVHEIPIVKGRRGFISEILYHYKDEKYSKEKEERFEKLAEKDKITHKTLSVRKNLFINSIKNQTISNINQF